MANPMRTKRRPTNNGSRLLEEHENDSLFNLLAEGDYTIESGVAQLLAAEVRDRNRWHLRHTGALCLIKSYTAKGYFLRLYDLPQKRSLWEQQLYEDFQVRAPHPQLLTFEGDDCVFGLNFADRNEAAAFKNQLDKRYKVEQEKKAEQPPPAIIQQEQQPPAGVTSQNITVVVEPVAKGPASFFKPKKKNKKNKKEEEHKRKKELISTPSDFKHVATVSWTMDKGFSQHVQDGGLEDPTIKAVLEQSGFKVDHLSKHQRKALAEVADTYGGYQRMTQLMQQEQKLKKPAGPPPPPPPPPSMAPPPPPIPPPVNSPKPAPVVPDVRSNLLESIRAFKKNDLSKVDDQPARPKLPPKPTSSNEPEVKSIADVLREKMIAISKDCHGSSSDSEAGGSSDNEWDDD